MSKSLGKDWGAKGSSFRSEFKRSKASVADKLRRRNFDVTVYFIESELQAIEKAAKKAGISKSDVVRQIVRKAFKLGKDDEAVRKRKPNA